MTKEKKTRKNKPRHTAKKQDKRTSIERNVVAGHRDVIDPETGEIRRINNLEISQVDFNFDKVWLAHLIGALEIVGNKKISVMNWLLDNRDERDNFIYATQAIIQDEVGVAAQTVTDTFNALHSVGALIKIRNGVYQLNPDIVWVGGNSKKRLDILLTYKNIANIDEDEESQGSVKALPKPAKPVDDGAEYTEYTEPSREEKLAELEGIMLKTQKLIEELKLK